MESFPFEYSLKIWSPTSLELRKFSSDINKVEMDKKMQMQPLNMTYALQDISIHTFLYKLTKKCTVHCVNHHQTLELMEEDAVSLCNMLKKEGFLELNGDSDCAACATESLEKRIVQQMKQQLKIIKMARNFYSQTNNMKYYRLCSKHRRYSCNCRETKCHQQACHSQQIRQNIVTLPAQVFYFAEPIFILPALYSNGLEPQILFDSFIPVPRGIHPLVYLANYNEWVRYLQQFYGTTQHKRFSYTNCFPLKNNEERKIVGRRFV